MTSATPLESRSSAARRLLRLALSCLVISTVAGLTGWLAPPPGAISAPKAPGVLREVVVVRAADGDRVVERAAADLRVPTYEFNVATRWSTNVGRSLGLDTGGRGLDGSPRPMLSLGLYHRISISQFELMGTRIDAAPGSPERYAAAPADALARWRPMAAAYLNASRPGGRAGDELESFLASKPYEQSWMCWQNGCVLTAWLTGLAAIVLLFAAGAAVVLAPKRLGSPMDA